jgi:hypothetical protein
VGVITKRELAASFGAETDPDGALPVFSCSDPDLALTSEPRHQRVNGFNARLIGIIMGSPRTQTRKRLGTFVELTVDPGPGRKWFYRVDQWMRVVAFYK